MSDKLEEFYQALSEEKKDRVENKLRTMLREGYYILPTEKVNPMRFQLASDMFKLLKG